jgi:hypothetical protein
MKRLAALVLLLSVFAVSVLLTTVEGFRNLNNEKDGFLVENVGALRGHVAPLLATSFVWSRYPAAPAHPTALISEKAFLLTVPLLLVALYFARIRGRRPFLFQVAVCLAVAPVPYVVGTITLHGGTITDRAEIGPWLAVMILGPLYALIICAVICVVELLRPRARSRSICDRIPLECSPITTPAPRQ